MIRGGGVFAEFVKRFRAGLVSKAHRPLYHPMLGLRVIKKNKTNRSRVALSDFGVDGGEQF